MYLIEIILKKLTQRKERIEYSPILEVQEQDPKKEAESCEHIFMPIDSTGETLACSNCGLLKKRHELKNINFFMEKKD